MCHPWPPSGFEYQLESFEDADPASLAQVVQGLIAATNQDARLAREFSTYGASAPSLYLDIDRGKAQSVGLHRTHERGHASAIGQSRLPKFGTGCLRETIRVLRRYGLSLEMNKAVRRALKNGKVYSLGNQVGS
jgi:multidrug efflux pump subunit AcrB